MFRSDVSGVLKMTAQLVKNLRKMRIYQRRHLKFDFVAAIVVFLVAIPLCLGIALASNAPPLSGILSGILGGIIVGLFSGSQVSVSGPAAGLVAVVLAALAQLGDFNTFLLALVIAGAFQIVIGALRAGFIADYVPSNVIQGLLCAIGILLIVKQLHSAFSLDHNLKELKGHLIDAFKAANINDLHIRINSGATFISLSSIALLVFFDKTKSIFLKTIPGPIVVVAFGIIINQLFALTGSSFVQDGLRLVNIPKFGNIEDFLSQIQSPNWTAWNNPKVYAYGAIIALVASLETLLNVKAGEKLDKKRRSCSKDRELFAQGFGNLIAGFIGGLPITSVVVRTSVSIQAGSRTKIAAILHGVFLLLAVMLAAGMLNQIPLSCLAAILIHTGYKLNKPSIYRAIYVQGLERFIPFIVTLIGIVTIDLLMGIILGLMVSAFFILKSNSRVRLDIIKENYPNGMTNRLVLPQQTTFLNKASLVAELETIPKNSQLIIDARYSHYIDKEVIELINEFKNELAPMKQISLNLIGFKEHYDIHNYIDFINVTTYDVQSTLTPARVLHVLEEGNNRFIHDTRIHRCLKTDVEHTADTQHPIAVVLGCIDSRVPIETIFDMTLGDIFCIRIAGNVINEDVLASIEFACHGTGTKLIVVLGHTSCGAIQAACDHIGDGNITQLRKKIEPAINAETTTKDNRNSKNKMFLHNVTELNTAQSITQIYNCSPIIKKMTDEESIGLAGAIYDVNTGRVKFEDFSNILPLLGEKKDGLLGQKLNKLITDASSL